MRRGRRPGGFTLLELLVVIFIIGVVLGLVVLSINPGADEGLRTEARRFAALVSLAGDEAVLQGREMAVEFSADGYTFLALGDEQWDTIDDKVFHARHLPEGTAMDVYLDDGQAGAGGGEQPPARPRIYLFSSGERTPFEVILRDEQGSGGVRVAGGIGGKLTVSGRDGG